MVGDINGFLFIFFMLDIEFTTFYPEMHGNDHKILKTKKTKLITQYKHNIKMQYSFSSSFVSITHDVSILEAKHLFHSSSCKCRCLVYHSYKVFYDI